jgi:hypothetical protein
VSPSFRLRRANPFRESPTRQDSRGDAPRVRVPIDVPREEATMVRTPLAVAILAAATVALTACADDASPIVTVTTSGGPAVSPSSEPSPTPTDAATPAPHTVLMHDGVLRAELPESFEPDEWGSWTDGTATIGCWAWRDSTIPLDGVTAAQIMSTWLAWWNDWGYYSADEVWPFANVNGYEDSDVWYVVMIYTTSDGTYDFEVWEPHAYLVDDDVFIECSARVFSPAEAPTIGWDAAFLPLVESVTIVDRPAILTNYWGTERGDD